MFPRPPGGPNEAMQYVQAPLEAGPQVPPDNFMPPQEAMPRTWAELTAEHYSRLDGTPLRGGEPQMPEWVNFEQLKEDFQRPLGFGARLPEAYCDLRSHLADLTDLSPIIRSLIVKRSPDESPAGKIGYDQRRSKVFSEAHQHAQLCFAAIERLLLGEPLAPASRRALLEMKAGLENLLSVRVHLNPCLSHAHAAAFIQLAKTHFDVRTRVWDFKSVDRDLHRYGGLLAEPKAVIAALTVDRVAAAVQHDLAGAEGFSRVTTPRIADPETRAQLAASLAKLANADEGMDFVFSSPDRHHSPVDPDRLS